MLFYEYFGKWVDENKVGFVREVTLRKYKVTHRRLGEIAPDLELENVNRKAYQLLLNQYGETHERQTVIDFHHQLKAAILDAVDEGIIEHDPTRKIVIRGKIPSKKREKYLSQKELGKLLQCLELDKQPNYDLMILLIAKTGIRFAEALAVTPDDFDFASEKLRISKSWDYKQAENSGFVPTKNISSNRVIDIDRQTATRFHDLVAELPQDKPVFIPDGGRVFNATVNSRMANLCRLAGVPEIGIHGLRHTHASLLIYAGVSIPSVARRLGHANTTTTQETYIHIIRELENKDKDLVISYLAEIG